MSAPAMSYATQAWAPRLVARLRGSDNDAYPRPMIQECDDAHDELFCGMCQGSSFGSADSARWVPDEGGAWVMSGSWRAAGGDRVEYDRRVDELDPY